MTSQTDDIKAVIGEIDHAMKSLQSNWERLRAMARQPEALEQPMQAPVPAERYETAASAFRRHGFQFNDLKVQRTCRDHAGEKDFAIKFGTWNVRQPLFDLFAEEVKRGVKRF